MDLCWQRNVSAFTVLARLVAFLPRSKRLLISWLESPSVVILEVPQNKIFHCFHCLPIYLLWNLLIKGMAGNKTIPNEKSFLACFLLIPGTQCSSVQSLNRVQLFVAPWTAARQASLFITNFQSLLKLMSTESVTPSNHLILCCPLLFLPSIFSSITECS